ncbi:hypothetical protein F4775DRAFT_592826 [Biscogniauxia sp. FL1348]|nr:hypothetical protein F4775DRAFT_592826 [Biscogniauxia sp. FL1348]
MAASSDQDLRIRCVQTLQLCNTRREPGMRNKWPLRTESKLHGSGEYRGCVVVVVPSHIEEPIPALEKVVDFGLKLDYPVTGGWSLQAYQETGRPLKPEFVNLASDSRVSNGGKFGKVLEEMDEVEFPNFPEALAHNTDGSGPIVVANINVFVYIAGQMLLEELLSTYSNKVDGQEADANTKAALTYNVLEAHPEIYKINGDIDCSASHRSEGSSKRGTQ